MSGSESGIVKTVQPQFRGDQCRQYVRAREIHLFEYRVKEISGRSASREREDRRLAVCRGRAGRRRRLGVCAGRKVPVEFHFGV